MWCDALLSCKVSSCHCDVLHLLRMTWRIKCIRCFSFTPGNSQSDYDTVVHAFYSCWQSYFTRKPYYWVDKYDLRDAPNRRVQRLMEKENKKLRDAAKKQRNETVKVRMLLSKFNCISV